MNAATQARQEATPTVMLSARVPEGLRREARVFAAQRDIDMADVVRDALAEYLKRHGGA